MARELYVGIMSGTSLDGVDAVLADFGADPPVILANASLSFPPELKALLLRLNTPGTDELEQAAQTGIELSRHYAQAARDVLSAAEVSPGDVLAIGCHGQTVRHRPDLGYSIQLGSPAWLAELTGITVVADFRSRDVAAGGQGAPLVPAFHEAAFGNADRHRVIANIGGISNVTHIAPGKPTRGFDCGPGNLLMDTWIAEHLGKSYDAEGAWAETGKWLPDLLRSLYAHPFFHATPPKSTGRDEFNREWLQQYVAGRNYEPQDVQATLLRLTAVGIADSIRVHCPGAQDVYVCGGGSRNMALCRAISGLLPGLQVELTDALGVPALLVEAYAFAWLARQALKGLPGNLPQVTGARRPVILGAIYPR